MMIYFLFLDYSCKKLKMLTVVLKKCKMMSQSQVMLRSCGFFFRFGHQFSFLTQNHCTFSSNTESIKSFITQELGRDYRLVPGLKNMPVPVLVTLKIRYTNRKAPAQRPFLLAGELALLPAEFQQYVHLIYVQDLRPGTILVPSYAVEWRPMK